MNSFWYERDQWPLFEWTPPGGRIRRENYSKKIL